jgi:hypothetical protein
MVSSSMRSVLSPLTHTGTSLLNRLVAFSTYEVFHDDGSPSTTCENAAGDIFSISPPTNELNSLPMATWHVRR